MIAVREGGGGLKPTETRRRVGILQYSVYIPSTSPPPWIYGPDRSQNLGLGSLSTDRISRSGHCKSGICPIKNGCIKQEFESDEKFYVKILRQDLVACLLKVLKKTFLFSISIVLFTFDADKSKELPRPQRLKGDCW